MKIFDAIAKYSIYALIFLLPLFFMPFSADMFDFPKQTLLSLLVFIALFCKLAKILISGKVSFAKSKLHLAALALLAVAGLSTIFSVDRYGSFWGRQGMASESFFSLLAMVALYFMVSSEFSRKEISASAIILAISGIISSVLASLQMLGIFMPVDFAKTAAFNTVGGVGKFGIFLAILLPLLMVLEIYSKKYLKVIFGIGIFVAAFAFVLVNYALVWWMVLISSAFVMLLGMIRKDLFDLRWQGLPMFFMALALFFIIIQPQISLPQRPLEVYLNQQASLGISFSALRENPILGSGPGTFGYDFLKFKSQSLNQGNLWNLYFPQAGSKFLTIFATTGLLGIAAFVALIGIAIFSMFRFFSGKSQSKSENWLPAAGVIIALAVSVAAFFTDSSNITLDFVFFLLLAFLAAFIGENKKDYEISPASPVMLGFTFACSLALIFGLGLLILDGQRYYADVNYFSGLKALAAEQKDAGIALIETAVKNNPSSDAYLSDLSQIYLSEITAVAENKDLKDEDKSAKIQLLVNNAINAAKMATDANPENATAWSNRGNIYLNLIGTIDGAGDWAVKSYQEASKLAPQNPFYATQQGVVYYKMEDYGKAKEYFEKALSLKSDYKLAQDGLDEIAKKNTTPKPEPEEETEK